MAFRDTLLKSWQNPTILTWVLWPLSVLYRVLFSLRQLLYKTGIKKRYRAPVPVIVIGNITVGGTGKTPLVIYLLEFLAKQGFKPGVISRGYSGSAESYPLTVTTETPVSGCGDEPSLIVSRTNAPMVVGPNRAESIQQLLKEFDVDIVISDDGLQHLAMQRDIEICLQDSTKTSTNFHLLPAGPYRESLSRLKSIDLLVQHISLSNDKINEHVTTMNLVAGEPQPLVMSNTCTWSAETKVHAIAGIGNPERFFSTCRAIGLDIIEHPFADHHQFSASDLKFNDQLPVLMTEKDAVKCVGFANQQHWYLPVDAKLSANFDEQIIEFVKNIQEV